MRLVVLVALFLAIPSTILAQGDEGGIDVIDVSGPLDASALEFMADSIEAAARDGQVLSVLQINSRAVLDGDGYDRLVELLAAPPLPVATWVGPAPAVAHGGSAVIAMSAENAAIAPGSDIGRLTPVILGAGPRPAPDLAVGMIDRSVTAEQSGLELQPTLRQYLQQLDGRTFDTATGPVDVSTIIEFGDGVTLRQVTFRKPGLTTRFFRLAATPEAAFFFLVVGLSVVTFEFYALGPGVAAGVGALSLLPAGWGLVSLPTRWWALSLVFVGWGLLTAGYQKGGFIGLAAVGTALLQLGGMTLIDGAGQIDPRWWLVLPSVLAVLFFLLIAMPTVERARLSTQTIGRESLIGRSGSAVADFIPNGMVEVDGARWQATAHREANLEKGSPIVVTGVDGLYLEVEPVEAVREN